MRRGGPFIAINCGAIPAGLIEAELFGYEKGSFTGAVRAHAGVFERANGGTLLLDEVTEMPLGYADAAAAGAGDPQVLSGGRELELSTDVRVIAATNRCPLQAVQSGQLREDLLYRLAVFPDRHAAAAQPRKRRGVARRAFLGGTQCAGAERKSAFRACAHDAQAAHLAGQRA